MDGQFSGLIMTVSSLPMAKQQGPGEKIKGDPRGPTPPLLPLPPPPLREFISAGGC
jgi:hypothetical protein